jgi:thiamine-phosphate pyrophosphorylase
MSLDGPLVLPRLYAILDADLLVRRGISVKSFASQMRDAGVTLLQYRDKTGPPQQILSNAKIISEVFAGSECMLILNDRADLAKLAGWDGVHVGQGDLSPAGARGVMGVKAAPGIIGISTHNEMQLRAADASGADYIAVGPVFTTGTKENSDPVVGLDGVKLARSLTSKPLVAIGGITRENAASVIAAGADSVAVISDLLGNSGDLLPQGGELLSTAADDTPEKSARDFMLRLR